MCLYSDSSTSAFNNNFFCKVFSVNVEKIISYGICCSPSSHVHVQYVKFLIVDNYHDDVESSTSFSSLAFYGVGKFLPSSC